jgi:hypothetical protein
MFTLVGAVPSGFTLAGVRLTGVAFAGVVFAVVEDAAAVVFFTGVLLTALAGWVCAAPVAGFLRMGSGLVVPSGVRVRAGFEASATGVLPAVTGVFFTGVAADAGLLAGVAVTGFFTGVVVFAGVEADAPAAFSFLGTRFAGAAADPVVSVAVATGFFTGVVLAVVVVGFAAVDPATLEIFPILAERELGLHALHHLTNLH